MKILDERETQKANTERNKGTVQALVKVGELNGFVVHLSKIFSN